MCDPLTTDGNHFIFFHHAPFLVLHSLAFFTGRARRATGDGDDGAMEMGLRGSRCIFGRDAAAGAARGPVRVAPERDAMRAICAEHGVPLFYYEAAMGLWARVKSAYECESFVHGPERFLFMCLSLAVKWAGPASLTFQLCRLQGLRRHYPYATARSWQLEEARMCALLGWEFF
jgi:hypothetical protein